MNSALVRWSSYQSGHPQQRLGHLPGPQSLKLKAKRYLTNKHSFGILIKSDAMATKSISSTTAQNNFGQVLDDVTHNHTRYVVERRGVPQAIILSFDDFTCLLGNEQERQYMNTVLRELRPEYHLGQVIVPPPQS
jgi:prevent-host-death family protein